MAYSKFRSRKRWTRWSAFRSTARRYGGRARNWAGRNKGGMMKYLPYAGGAVAGYFAPRVIPYQDLIVTALAVAPVRMPYSIKWIAQGYVAGAIVRTFLPNVMGQSAATGGNVI